MYKSEGITNYIGDNTREQQILLVLMRALLDGMLANSPIITGVRPKNEERRTHHLG